MGSKTKTVGGGQATGTANAFNNWMLNGLQTGNFGSGAGGASSGVGQAGGQTNAFGSAVNSMLGGNAGQVPTSLAGYFDQVGAGTTGAANLPGTPAFRETNFAQLPTTGVSGYDPNTFSSLFGANGKGGAFGGMGPAQAQGFGVNFNSGSYGATKNAIQDGGGQLLNVDYNNNPEMKALVDTQNRAKAMDQANLRARFGSMGTGMSSGASLAESQYLADANPKNTLALGELGRQMQGIDMQNRGQNYNALLQQMGIQSGERGQNMNADLGAATATAGNMTNASMANAGNANQFGIQQMAAMLQAKGMDADNAFKNASMMAGNTQTNNQNMFGNNTAFNDFNRSNFGQESSNALNNQGQMNQFGLGKAGVGTNLMGLGNQSQSQMMQMLMQQYGNINQIGTPQAQTVEQQNPWMQGLTALGGIAQGAGSFMGGLGSFMNAGKGATGAMNFGNMASNLGGAFNSPTNYNGMNTFNPTSGYGNSGVTPLGYGGNRTMTNNMNALFGGNNSGYTPSTYDPRMNLQLPFGG